MKEVGSLTLLLLLLAIIILRIHTKEQAGDPTSKSRPCLPESRHRQLTSPTPFAQDRKESKKKKKKKEE